MEHRGRAVEAERVQRRRAHHVRAEQVLLRSGQARSWRRSRRSRSRPTPPSTTCCSRRAARTKIQRGATCLSPGRPGKAGQRDRGPEPAVVQGVHAASPWYTWGMSYYPLNLPVDQRRPRRDLQAAVLPAGHGLHDEPEVGIIAGPLKGYGQLTVGPVGSYPGDPSYLSPPGQSGDPFPYNPPRQRACSPATAGRWSRAGRRPASSRAPRPVTAARGSPRAAR